MSPRPLPGGAYAATLTFFNEETEELDPTTLRLHVTNLIRSGIQGIVALGSNGEAPHLNANERQIVVKAIRAALDEAGSPLCPVIVGCSAASVRGTVELCHEAAKAGGDYALVLPPSYFHAAMTPAVIASFYAGVADQSPIPIILYSFPAVSAGIEMTSDLLIDVSRHANIIGTKFTCGDTGKLNRVQSAMLTAGKASYTTFAGLADFELPALVAGATAIIAGGANVAPKACVRVYDLFKRGELKAAMDTQELLAAGDWIHTKTGVAGTKSVLQKWKGYGGYPRRPLQPLPETAVTTLLEEIGGLMEWEVTL